MSIAERILAVEPATVKAVCDWDIFHNGKNVLTLAGERASRIEEFVSILRERTGEPIDWHYFAGRGQILTVGDRDKVRQEARNMLEEVRGCLNFVER